MFIFITCAGVYINSGKIRDCHETLINLSDFNSGKPQILPPSSNDSLSHHAKLNMNKIHNHSRDSRSTHLHFLVFRMWLIPSGSLAMTCHHCIKLTTSVYAWSLIYLHSWERACSDCTPPPPFPFLSLIHIIRMTSGKCAIALKNHVLYPWERYRERRTAKWDTIYNLLLTLGAKGYLIIVAIITVMIPEPSHCPELQRTVNFNWKKKKSHRSHIYMYFYIHAQRSEKLESNYDNGEIFCSAVLFSNKI